MIWRPGKRVEALRSGFPEAQWRVSSAALIAPRRYTVTETLERTAAKRYQQFINGQWVDSSAGETLDVINPANDEVVAIVPASAAEDVDQAVNAAATAFEKWQKTTPQERMSALLKLADIVETNADELSALEA